MSDTLKQYLDTNMLRGQYFTDEETPLDSPLQWILWMAWQQTKRNNRQQVIEAANGEL